MEKKKKTPALLAALALLLLLALGIGFAVYLTDKRKEHIETPEETTAPTEEIRISQTEEESTEPSTEPETEYVSPIDFQALWAVNPDVVGWLTIPDTQIDYPILQGKDNDQYLHTDMEGNETVAGEIFLDFEDEGDFSSLHNIIYGHHMKNGTMFKDVVYFKEQEFFDAHSRIVIYTPEREIQLEPLAALYTSPDGIRRKTYFRSEEGFRGYVEAMTEGALAKSEPRQPVERLYSFVTCSYEFSNARTILYAYEVDNTGSEKRVFYASPEDETEDETGAKEHGEGEKGITAGSRE